MWKNIHKKIDRLLSWLIILIFVPLFAVIIGQRVQLEEIIYGEIINEEKVLQKASDADGHEEMEQKLIGIVANEIGADASEEAILAQCVIARTNFCDAEEKNTTEPEALSIEQMKNLWGVHFEECYQKMERCVNQTKGKVLRWEDDYIYAAYHAISAGSTRNMEELYTDVRMPYLKVQACQKDASAEGYLAVSYWKEEEFVEKCNELFEDGAVADGGDVTIERRDEAGYVLTIQVGKTGCEGEAFREAFDLPSACFTIAKIDDNIRIVTKGLGHGFGLSQNTANEMAKEGCTYQEILAYFFPGTTIETV